MNTSAMASSPETAAPLDCPTCGMPLRQTLNQVWRANASVPRPGAAQSSLWHCRRCLREFIVSRLPR